MTGHDGIFERNAERQTAKSNHRRRVAAMRQAEVREAARIRDEQARLKAEAAERRAASQPQRPEGTCGRP